MLCRLVRASSRTNLNCITSVSHIATNSTYGLPKEVGPLARSSTNEHCARTPSSRHFTQRSSANEDMDVAKSVSEDTQHDAEPEVPLVGQFKNPIVQKLWAAREEAKRRLSLSGDDARGDGIATTDVTKAAAAILKEQSEKATSTETKDDDASRKKKGKAPKESQTSISYPFSTDDFLLETYKNPWGSVRFGKILEDLDALAGNIAFNHVEGNPLIVTAGVDRIRLRRRPIIEHDQILSGVVTWVGTSSMEIRMSCREDINENINTKDANNTSEWLEAYFTFVTLDSVTKKPHKVTPLVPETQEERAHFELGALKAKNKKLARKNKLQIGQQLTEASLKIDKLAASLLDEAGPLLNMPSLANPHCILMKETKMQNAMIAQPQVRNLHDRIFGGFLMRRAFELAFATCYIFGGMKPIFKEVDDVSFNSPVDVGDLLVFNSRILYTLPEGFAELDTYYDKISIPSEAAATNNPNSNDNTNKGEDSEYANSPLITVEIECWKTVPEQTNAKISNYFYFTFALPTTTSNQDDDDETTHKQCRKVLPGNIDEARRMASRMIADREQATLRS